jgi:hypothetical protein
MAVANLSQRSRGASPFRRARTGGDYQAMPLQWTISHSRRLVIAIAKGEMRPGTVIDFLARLDAEGARPYAKMFAMEQLVTVFTDESVLRLASMVRDRERESIVGPIAIIAGDDARWIDSLASQNPARPAVPDRALLGRLQD